MDPNSRRKIVAAEIGSYAVGGLAVLYYWFHASYVAIGVALTADWGLGILVTWLWLKKGNP